MIASMELQRPRVTPVLPQWDLGIVLPTFLGAFVGGLSETFDFKDCFPSSNGVSRKTQ